MTGLDGILRTNAPSRAPPRTNKYVPLVVGTSKKVARSVWTWFGRRTTFRFDLFIFFFDATIKYIKQFLFFTKTYCREQKKNWSLKSCFDAMENAPL
jgi:hypothetical protein